MIAIRGRRIVPIVSNESKIVTITIQLQSGHTSPQVEIPYMKYNKKSAIIMAKDDGGIEDYTDGYAYLNGGVPSSNGTIYSGVRYTDGAGKPIVYKMTFGLTTNIDRSGSNNTVTTWEQSREMLSNGFDISNHSYEHSGHDKLYQIHRNEVNIFNNTGFRTRTFIIPTVDEGYAASAPNLGYLMVASSFGVQAGDDYPDANDSIGRYGIYWGGKVNVRTFQQPTLFNRFYTENWTNTDIADIKTAVDNAFITGNSGTANTAVHWFSHGLSTNGNYTNFHSFMQYIKNHPNNNDSLWVPTMQEFSEYYEVRNNIIKSQIIEGDVMTVTLDYSSISDRNRYKDLSLILSGGVIENINVEGSNSYTYNTSTGLINIYKQTTQSDPSTDLLPAQIINVSKSGNMVNITYDKPVTQTVFSNTNGNAYTVSNNTILSINGTATNWTINCTSAVANNSTLDYRMQRGNATDANGLKVCSYIGYPIT